MSGMSVTRLNEVAAAKQLRHQQLQWLISQPFDIENKQQIQAISDRVKEFELHLHKMNLYQGLSESLKVWGGSWIVGYFLPIPQFINYILSSVLYFGIAGHILQNTSMTYFHDLLEEMKTVYNWTMKDGKHEYNPFMNNESKLANDTIKHMIEILAPVTETSELIAWNKVTENPIPAKAPSYIGSAISWGMSFFIDTNKRTIPVEESMHIQLLKTQVETRGFDLHPAKAFDQAIQYFATNPEFRNMLKSTVSNYIQSPMEQVKATVGSLITP